MPTRRRMLSATAAAAVLGLAGCSGEDDPSLSVPADPSLSAGVDHPEYGYDRTNRGAGPDAAGPGEAPAVVWGVETDRSVSAPAVVGDTVYVGDDTGTLRAVTTDGEERWQYEVGGTVRSTPAVADGVVYTGVHEGDYGYERPFRVVAVDAADGTERWQFDVGGRDSVRSPTVVDDTVYAPVAQRVVALEAASGDVRWETSVEGATPPAVDVAEGLVVSGNAVLDAGDGSVVRAFDGQERPAAVADGVAYLGGDSVLAYDLAAEEVLWERPPPDDERFVPCPTLDGETVYVVAYTSESGTPSATLAALDRGSGDRRWRTRLPADPAEGEPDPRSPVVAGDRVYTAYGALRALDRKSGETVWSFRPEVEFDTRPVVLDGSVLVGADGGLFGLAAGESG